LPLPPLVQPRLYFWAAMVFAISGAFATVAWVALAFAEQGRTRWPTVAGRVEYASASARDYEDEKGRPRRVYSPEVWYRYEVNGRTYQSHRIATGGWEDSNLAHVEKYLERYPSGSAVKVYVDPKNPAESRLEVGFDWLLWLGLPLALLFDGMGVWMFRIWHRSRRVGKGC
jgi:hypothetical protein